MLKKVAVIIPLILVFGFSVVFVPLLFNKRSLSENEINVLEPLYASSVDLSKIKVKTGGPLTWFGAGVTIGNTISFPKGAYTENFKADQAWLVHETCHVWQYQNFGLGYIASSIWEQITDPDAYVVHYDATKSLREYGVEQQCEIAAKYYLTTDQKYRGYIEEIQSQ